MYIRTGEGLGRCPTARSSPTCPRPTAFADCKFFFCVEGFARGSAKLLPHIEKDIRDIAKNIALTLKCKLPPLQPGKMRDFTMVFTIEGHVDKSTDPKSFGMLDFERASQVSWALQNELTSSKNFQLFSDKTNGVLIKSDNVRAGTSRPRPGITGALNRRVEVCIRTKLTDR
jgi:hypothetical protein